MMWFHRHSDSDALIKFGDKLDKALTLLGIIQQQQGKIIMDLSVLTAAVTANTNATQSAIVLIQGIAAQLALVKTNPAAVQALADQLNASATALAAAVTANTVAA